VNNTETVYARNVSIAAPTATPVVPATPTSTPRPVGYPAGGLDSPSDGLAVTGSVTLSGWAIDQADPTSTGVDRVRILVDGAYRADAQYGLSRPDIAAGYGSRFGASGYRYTLDLTGLAAGSHTLEAHAHSVVTGAEAIDRRAIVVTVAGAAHGGIEQPAEATQLTAATTVTVSGYALDAASTTGTGVDRVRVLVDDVYRGDAQYGLSRPDVAASYGARFDPTGYRYSLDLTGLAAGTHYVEARAHSTVNGVEARYIHSIVIPAAAPSPTPTTVASTDPRFGVNAHLLYAGLDRATADLDRVRAAHLGLVRLDVQWDLLELTQGVFDDGYLTKLDGVLDQAALHGARPILVVVGTPAWARGGTGTRLTPPTNPADFADALGRLATRYAGRHLDQPALAYEVWNEPNQAQFWDAAGGPNPIAYAALLKAAYPRVKAADPRAIVLGGSIAFDDHDFLDDLYTHGGIAGSFDGLALHPYSAANAPDAAGDGYHSFRLAVEQLGQVMAAHGEAGKPIWITEMGWSTTAVSDATRASYFQQAVALVRSWPQVVAFCAYQLSQDQDHPDYGLVAPGGTPTASWQAYGSAVAGP
jgi:polysaccharide biosynthesis protein PslG